MKFTILRKLILGCAALFVVSSVHSMEQEELAILSPTNAAPYQTVITRTSAFDENLRGLFSLRLSDDKSQSYHPLALTPKGNGRLYLADSGQTQNISQRKVENGVLHFIVTDHKGKQWQWQITAIKAPSSFPQANVLISIHDTSVGNTRTVYGELKPVS
ncbi:MAG: hypothetical protein OEW58_10835 [Gammaproteobacteria bacterium]|nr:hypothetical protein [Gammaproteobacteria bacterium]